MTSPEQEAFDRIAPTALTDGTVAFERLHNRFEEELGNMRRGVPDSRAHLNWLVQKIQLAAQEDGPTLREAAERGWKAYAEDMLQIRLRQLHQAFPTESVPAEQATAFLGLQIHLHEKRSQHGWPVITYPGIHGDGSSLRHVDEQIARADGNNDPVNAHSMTLYLHDDAGPQRVEMVVYEQSLADRIGKLATIDILDDTEGTGGSTTYSLYPDRNIAVTRRYSEDDGTDIYGKPYNLRPFVSDIGYLATQQMHSLRQRLQDADTTSM